MFFTFSYANDILAIPCNAKYLIINHDNTAMHLDRIFHT